MSEKELMYIEDALKHIQEFNKIGIFFIDSEDNLDVIDCLDDILDKNKKVYQKILKLLNK